MGATNRNVVAVVLLAVLALGAAGCDYNHHRDDRYRYGRYDRDRYGRWDRDWDRRDRYWEWRRERDWDRHAGRRGRDWDRDYE